MCGIAGIIAPEAEIYSSRVRKMVDAIAHRGPDGETVSVLDGCCLGHRRLSIIDLKSGDQPMKSPCADRVIVFNGEIYGYQKIRASFPTYPFATDSDTEVILALFDRFGAQCTSQLPGMFAFGIWDAASRSFFGARDRFGEKPFFFAWGRNGEFIFASEIKAILATGLVDPVLDIESLRHYLSHLYVHSARTIYENIHTLPPAHSITVENGKARVERYWSLPADGPDMTLSDAAFQFRDLFQNAVRNQLVADVPVGAFLSGGVDSTSVVAVASSFKTGLRTFSFGFEDSVSELPIAKESASRYRTQHTEMTAAHVDIAELMLRMQEVYDEPFADSSNIPTYLLCERASEQLKVVLTGDGGDELLGGYGWWYQALLADNDSPSRKQRTRPERAVARLATSISQRLIRERPELSARRTKSLMAEHADQNVYFTDNELDLMLGDRPAREVRAPRIADSSDEMNEVLRMDLQDYMPGDILVKVDRAAMAHGLELRAPFLDVDFASFCIALPSSFKVVRGRDKILLREAFADRWTRRVRKAPKRGFGAPVNLWLRRPSVTALVDKYLRDPQAALFSVVDFDASRDYIENCDYKTWALLVLAIWLDSHRTAVL